VASVSVSSLVLFIAAISVAGAVAGTLVTTVTDISEGIEERGADAGQRIETDVEVISDPGSDAVYNATADELVLLVKNTGTRRLSAAPEQFDLLVDGEYVPASAVGVTVLDESSDVWPEDAVVRLRVSRTLETGAHRVVVRVDGDEEVFEFRR
jgi:flagellar protein FlaG